MLRKPPSAPSSCADGTPASASRGAACAVPKASFISGSVFLSDACGTDATLSPVPAAWPGGAPGCLCFPWPAPYPAARRAASAAAAEARAQAAAPQTGTSQRTASASHTMHRNRAAYRFSQKGARARSASAAAPVASPTPAYANKSRSITRHPALPFPGNPPVPRCRWASARLRRAGLR